MFGKSAAQLTIGIRIDVRTNAARYESEGEWRKFMIRIKLAGMLQNQHAVAVAVESVFLLHGLAVGFEDELAGRHGTDKHEQGALRQMEIREQGINRAELIGRVEENIGAATLRSCGDALTGCSCFCEVLQHARDGGADRHQRHRGHRPGHVCGQALHGAAAGPRACTQSRFF